MDRELFIGEHVIFNNVGMLIESNMTKDGQSNGINTARDYELMMGVEFLGHIIRGEPLFKKVRK